MNTNEGQISCPFCRNKSGCKSSAHDYGRGNHNKFKQQHVIANTRHEAIPFMFPTSSYTNINNIRT